MNYGKAIRPFQGSRFCGDQCDIWEGQEETTVCLIDGLGHGEEAQIAAKKALSFISQNLHLPLNEIMHECDTAIKDTRGGAIGLARIYRSKPEFDYCAIGNTRACVIGFEERYIGGIYGIVGNGIETPKIEKTILKRNQTLALWSDGMGETLSLGSALRQYRGDLNEFAMQTLTENSVGDDDSSLILFQK